MGEGKDERFEARSASNGQDIAEGLSQREIQRKTGIDRKTIRRYAQSYHAAMSQGSEHSKSLIGQGVATGWRLSGPSLNTLPHASPQCWLRCNRWPICAARRPS